MKKISLILASLLIMSTLASCSQKDEPADTTTTTAATTTAAVTTTAETTTAAVTEEPEPTVQVDYGTPNLRTEGVDYHVHSLVIPTNNQNLDEEYIWDNTSSPTESYRFCDNMNYIIYKVDLSGLLEPTVDILILQNYKVSISPDGDNFDLYQEVLNYADDHSSTLTTGGNDITFHIDPYEYGFYKELYILIEDANPSDGWGGTIRSLTINQYVEGGGSDTSETVG